MIEEILVNLYKLKIPIPQSPLKSVNSYVVKSSQRNLIIDPGGNQAECMNTMKAGLRELKVDLRKTDFFVTHFHEDHIGLVWSLATETSTIYFNQPDADWITSDFHWDNFINFACMNGLPKSDLQTVLDSHPGYDFRSKCNPSFTILKEGDLIGIGDYFFKCVETPGHTIGHMGLYEPNKKIFVAGDHILNDITPSIQLWSHEGNPLKEYLASLDKVYKFDIELVLPGHRSIFRNFKERIQGLKRHHEERLHEVLSILEKGNFNAFQVASQMTWDIATEYESWDVFPVLQKSFATGEAIAHLRYLDEEGLVQRELHGQNIVFSLDLNHEI